MTRTLQLPAFTVVVAPLGLVDAAAALVLLVALMLLMLVVSVLWLVSADAATLRAALSIGTIPGDVRLWRAFHKKRAGT